MHILNDFLACRCNLTWLSFIEWHVRFTKLPLYLCLIENLWHIHNFLSENWLFSTAASLKKWLARISTIGFLRTYHIFCANISFAIFCAHFLRIKCNKFCAFLRFLRNLRKPGSFAQNVNSYAKHIIANWPKLTVSAQKQTTEGLIKNLQTNKLWFCCSQLVTFSYKIFKLRDKN